MKAKKYLLICLSVLMFAALAMFIVACGNTNSDFKFETYDYNPVDAGEDDWTEVDFPDTDMTLDGEVAASEYGEGYLSFTDINGVNMKVYAHLGDEGVFFGFVSNDRNVFYHEDTDVFNNTSVEIQVAPRDTARLDANVVQLRLGANGYAEQWVGFKAQDKAYDYTRKYLPSTGKVKINGELNSNTCQGYSMELYLPYSSLNLDGKPESVVCAPSFNTKPSYTSGPRATWTMMLGCNLSEPATWYVVDDSGMTTYTSGYDDSNYETSYTVTQTGTGQEFYYFGCDALDAFSLKATLHVVQAGLAGDGFPKFGLVSKSEESLVAFYVDAAGGTGNKFGKVIAEQGTNNGTQWGWATSSSHSMDGHWGDTYIREGNSYNDIEMQLVYVNDTLYMLLDDVLVYAQHDYKGNDDGAIPGFMTFNTALAFTDIDLITEADVVETLAEGFLPTAVKVDGDLSDWENLDASEEGNYLEATDSYNETSNGNTWKVRAFLGEDGLYIAYDVKHQVNTAQASWDEDKGAGGWFRNVNVEFFVGSHQYMLTGYGTGGYMDAVMTTTEVEGQSYRFQTYAEIFVPIENLAKELGVEASEISSVNVGFAFKTDDNMQIDLENGETMNGNNWWYFGGKPNTYQYTVTANGIQAKEEPVEPTSKKLDGDLSDWGGVHTLSVVGSGDFDGKSAEFYGEMVEGEGLYVAVDVHYGLHKTGAANWFDNTNFEFFVGTGTSQVQYYVYATGADEFKASHDYVYYGSKTTGTENAYHTIVEAFVPASYLTGVDDVARVGIAWKTVGDQINNSADLSGTSEYWLPQGTHQNNDHMSYVDSTGIYRWSDYGKTVDADITLDGALSDWEGVSTLSVVGTDEYEGKSATFYGVMTDKGLYLAVDAHYSLHVTDQAEWHLNTNFEFFIGMGGEQKQYYVYATGADEFAATPGAAFIQQESVTTGSDGSYHTIIEVFIPAANLSGVQEGTVRVGVAWKTNNDSCNNGSANNGKADSYWVPKGLWPSDDNKAVVTTTGIYTK